MGIVVSALGNLSHLELGVLVVGVVTAYKKSKLSRGDSLVGFIVSS